MPSFLACIATVTLLLSSSPSALSPRVRDATPFGGPEIIIFHDGVLEKAIAVATWEENQALLVSGTPNDTISAQTKSYLGTRPRIELALFWGNHWRDVARAPSRLAALTPAQANQHGVFYPAIAGARAIIAVGTSTVAVSDSGLAVLRRHGIPVEISRPHALRPAL